TAHRINPVRNPARPIAGLELMSQGPTATKPRGQLDPEIDRPCPAAGSAEGSPRPTKPVATMSRSVHRSRLAPWRQVLQTGRSGGSRGVRASAERMRGARWLTTMDRGAAHE